MKLCIALFAGAVAWFHATAETVLSPLTSLSALPQAAAAVAPPLTGPDLDGDGLSDLQEIRFGSDPTKPDTDGDGFTDKQEFDLHTDPRDRDKFPLFLLSTTEHQHLLGETLIIRATPLTNFIVYTNVTIVTNPAPTDGTPIDTDGDGTPDSCDSDDDGVADFAGDCPTTGPETVVTNTTVITNYVAYQWFAGTNQLATQTNSTLVLLNVGTGDSGNYRLFASLELASQLTTAQTSDDVPVNVLPLAARVRLPQPVGKVIAWGNNVAGQTSPRVFPTNAVQVAAGFLHSVALLADGTVTVWGDSQLGQTSIPRNATNITAIAAGSGHVVALSADSTVLCWGTNQFGQATPPADLTNVVAVSAGYFHSVALRADGTVVCWGDNTFNQCQLPADLPPIIKISAGLFHNVALAADGTVICWGDNTDGQSNTAGVTDLLTNLVVEVAAGGNHSVALRRDGILVAWGGNEFTQTDIPAGLPKATGIAAGYGFTAAISFDGKITAWGDQANPIATPPAHTRAVQVAGGYFHLLGIDAPPDTDADGLDNRYETANGTSLSQVDSDRDGFWDGVEARLGSNPSYADTDGDGLPDPVELLNGFDPQVATEAPDGSLVSLPAVEIEYFVSGRTTFQMQGSADGAEWLDLGSPFAPRRGITRVFSNAVPEISHYRLLPVASSGGEPLPEAGPPEPIVIGTVAAFGNGELGQTNFSPTLGNIVSLAAGVWHTLALHPGGSVSAWGLNSDGQCDVPEDLAEVTAIAGGGRHSLALRATGEIVGWGNNDYGQLDVPQLEMSATAIAAGGSHSLALLLDGTVLAWGANDVGQTDVPAGLNNVVAIAAGRFHSVAVRGDGSVVCWGDNRYGQSTVPAGLAGVTAVAAGFSHTVALLSNGRVVCWGNNTDGQCNVPGELAAVTAVFAGNTRTIVRTTAGSYVVWGENAARLTQQLADFGSPAMLAVGGVHVSAANVALDADNDGVDDHYEQVLGTDPTKNDSDGDGLDDQTEILAGFDPTKATESADGATRIYPALKLRFFTLDGSRYRLERSSDLLTWRPDSALRPSAEFANRHGYSEVFQSFRTRERQFFRLLKFTEADEE